LFDLDLVTLPKILPPWFLAQEKMVKNFFWLLKSVLLILFLPQLKEEEELRNKSKAGESFELAIQKMRTAGKK
jgi:hypothetical protein